MAVESALLGDNDTAANPRIWRHEELVRFFRGDDIFATTLLTFCIDRFTMECLDWTPQTLHHELLVEFGINLPKDNLDKLLAAMSILESDDYFQRLPMFCPLTEALCGNGLQFDTVAMPDALECAWGITEALMLSPGEEDQRDLFVPEISGYIQAICREEGLFNPPPILRIAGNFHADYSALDLGDPLDALGTLGAKADDAKDMERLLGDAMRNLTTQLRSLPLSNGKVDF